MGTDLENFLATTEHRRPDRVLFSASYTPDLQRRVIEHIGTEDIAGHYGYVLPPQVGLRKPDHLPTLDYSKYWENEELPEGTKIAGGVAMVPSGFYHFWGYISPLRNATSLKEIMSHRREALPVKYDPPTRYLETAPPG